jgi:hypothetical protein
MTLETEKSRKMAPISVMPTSNLRVMYNEKKGNNRGLPIRSIKAPRARIQKRRGYVPQM